MSDAGSRGQWIEEHEKLLYAGRAEQLIGALRRIIGLSGKKEESRLELISYYEDNKGRMDYEAYRKTGAGLIGSGAIEAAHRSVVQKRMKLSGQRWTVKGASHMLAVRKTKMSGDWDNIVQLITRPTPPGARAA